MTTLQTAMTPSNTALLMIDFQRDFCSPGGYSDHVAGLDWVSPILPFARQLLDRVRELGVPVYFTRENYAPDLSDCPPERVARSRRAGAEYGTQGPMGRFMIRGEAGNDIVPQLYPHADEVVLDKSTYGAFQSTTLDQRLRIGGIKYLGLAGVTADVCVHTTLREAVDRGYECFYLKDVISTFDADIRIACERMVETEGGVWGQLTTTTQWVDRLAGCN